MNDELLMLLMLLGFKQHSGDTGNFSEFGLDPSKEETDQHWLCYKHTGQYTVYIPEFEDDDGNDNDGKVLDTDDVQLVINYYKDTFSE